MSVTYKNIFLEGRPGTGKSTIILKCIDPVRHLAAGFMTARVFGSEGAMRGFAQYPAMTKKMTNETSLLSSGPDIISDGDEPVRFLVFDEREGKALRPDVLKEGIRRFLVEADALCASGERSFIVLDETGGLELLDPETEEILKAAVASPYPCIGVLKSREHARSLLKDSALEKYEAWYEFLDARADTRIVRVTEETRDEAEEAAREWMEAVKQTDPK